jgi:hypothetical protein
MMKKVWYVALMGVILVAGVFIAGCSSDSSSAATITVPTTAAAQATKFVAGDIVGKTSTSTDSVWLIIAYDKTKDQYERALIFKNSGGTWGYRTGNATEKISRVTVDKLYVKISHVTVTSVPVVTPTVPTTIPTTLSGYAPSITSISPTSGATGGSVTVTITGANFQSGATVKLVQAGYAPVTATGVSVSSSSITATFSLSSLEKGSATIQVTNPDGQIGDLVNKFTIGEAAPVISAVTPVTGIWNSTVAMTITGQNFKEAVLVKLTKDSTELICTSPTTSSDGNKITCNLDIGMSSVGDWTLTVKNIESLKTGTYSRTFAVNAT